MNNFTFLSIFDWRCDDGWQTLLESYINAFGPNDEVNLIFKPYGAELDEVVESVSNWLKQKQIDEEEIPCITFVQEPLLHATLAGFYTGANAFVCANGSGNGIWHLTAQACGLDVISCGHFSFLKNPFSQIFKAGDIEHLSWLMSKSSQKKINPNPTSIRAYLEPIHHAAYLQPRITKRIERWCGVDYMKKVVTTFI